MRILLASHTAPGGVFAVGSHHLARELRVLGHEVLHVSSPVSLLHVVRLHDPEVRRRFRLALDPRRRRDGDLVPLTLLPMSAAGRLLSRLALRTSMPPITGALRRRGFAQPDVLLVDQPLFAGLERHVRCRLLVYRSTDLVGAGAKGDGERWLLELADGVVGTSPVVLSHLLDVRPGSPNLLLENGVEFSRFANDDAGRATTERSGAVYVGAIDDRFDWDVVSDMATANPGVLLTVFGPVSARPQDLPRNIDVRGPVPYAHAAELLRGARVGLLPFTPTAVNRGRSPMKLYEYLAAGLNVVSTMPVRDDPPGVFSSGDGGPGAALRRAVEAPDNVDGVEVARGMDWNARAVQLVDFLAGLTRSAERPGPPQPSSLTPRR